MRYLNVTWGSYMYTTLTLTRPRRTRGFIIHGTISVRFCTEVDGWLRYKVVKKKYCQKF